MKRKSFYLTFLILILCSGCFSKKEQLAPSNLHGLVIETFTEDSFSSDEVGLTYFYHFEKDNTYKLFYNNRVENAGNYSYHVEGHQKAQLVTSYSKRDRLNSYATIFYFETPTTGTWKGSYYKSSLEGEKGTFIIHKKGETK